MVEETEEEKKAREAKEEQEKLDKEQLDAAKKEEESIDKIDKANEAAERLERANKKHEELVLRQEKIAINDKLGGKSEMSEKPTEAEKIKEGAKKLVPEGMDCPGVTD